MPDVPLQILDNIVKVIEHSLRTELLVVRQILGVGRKFLFTQTKR